MRLQRSLTLTSACSAKRWRVTRRSSRARTASRRRGPSCSRSSAARPRSTPTSPAAGGRPRPCGSRPRSAAGIRRRRGRRRRAEHGDDERPAAGSAARRGRRRHQDEPGAVHDGRRPPHRGRRGQFRERRLRRARGRRPGLSRARPIRPDRGLLRRRGAGRRRPRPGAQPPLAGRRRPHRGGRGRERDDHGAGARGSVGALHAGARRLRVGLWCRGGQPRPEGARHRRRPRRRRHRAEDREQARRRDVHARVHRQGTLRRLARTHPGEGHPRPEDGAPWRGRLPRQRGGTLMTQDLDRLCIDTIRTLAIDAVQQANSGHPGTPMAMAPLVYCLWQRVLRFDPADPIWPNRDRFVLSAGHASMLLWALLHLTGTKAVNASYEVPGEPSVTLDDIRRFRQLDSKCPGHPEYRWTSGVETTTGPLGQGVATSVGMAIAAKWMASHFNRPGFEMFDYDVYALAGDGCMMEGVSSEAASLAGHLKLANLCWVYDNNKITIEGHTEWAFSEDVATRFISYGWNVTRVGDANDLEMLERAFTTFRTTRDRPTLVIVDSHIAWGAPNKQDTHAAHGEPLGDEEIRLTKRNYGWPEDARFLVPDGVREHFAAGVGARGHAAREAWLAKFEAYRATYPELADHLFKMQHRRLPDGWDKGLAPFAADPKGVAGRDASAKVLNILAQNTPWLIGGAADLAPSTKTRLTFEGAGDFTAAHPDGRNL